jgi:hypothetical protein
MVKVVPDGSGSSRWWRAGAAIVSAQLIRQTKRYLGGPCFIFNRCFKMEAMAVRIIIAICMC